MNTEKIETVDNKGINVNRTGEGGRKVVSDGYP